MPPETFNPIESVGGCVSGCPVRMSNPSRLFKDGDPCGRKPYEGDPEGRCLLHTEEDKDADTFFEAFLELIEEADDGRLDATRFVIPDFALTGFALNCSVNFREARFTGNVSFRETDFSGGAMFMEAEFSGGFADFRDAKFSGGTAVFGDAKFSGGPAIFLRTEFTNGLLCAGAEFSGGRANFQEAEFSGGVTFAKAKFSGGSANFGKAMFSTGLALFYRAEFSGGDVNFRGVEFSGALVSFEEALFVHDAHFQVATFEERAGFNRVTVTGSLNLRNAIFKDVTDWGGAVLLPGGVLTFEETVIEGELRLQDVQAPTRNLDAWRRLVEARFDSVAGDALTGFDESDDGPAVRVDLRNVRLGPQGRVRLVGAQGARGANIEEVADEVEENQPEIARECSQAAASILGDESPRRQLDVTRYRFAHSPVERFRFQNVSWRQEPAWRSGLDRLWMRENQIARIADEDDIVELPGARTGRPPDDAEALTPSIVADTYRGIRASYERALNYAEAGRFHRREMEMRRLVARDEGPWGQRTVLTLYRIFGRYGESAGQPLAWLLGLVIFWGFFEGKVHEILGGISIYLGIEPFADQLMRGLQDVLSPFVVGETLPSLFVRVWGIFLVGLFLVGLRRRYRRGSAGGKLG